MVAQISDFDSTDPRGEVLGACPEAFSQSSERLPRLNALDFLVFIEAEEKRAHKLSALEEFISRTSECKTFWDESLCVAPMIARQAQMENDPDVFKKYLELLDNINESSLSLFLACRGVMRSREFFDVGRQHVVALGKEGEATAAALWVTGEALHAPNDIRFFWQIQNGQPRFVVKYGNCTPIHVTDLPSIACLLAASLDTPRTIGIPGRIKSADANIIYGFMIDIFTGSEGGTYLRNEMCLKLLKKCGECEEQEQSIPANILSLLRSGIFDESFYGLIGDGTVASSIRFPAARFLAGRILTGFKISSFAQPRDILRLQAAVARLLHTPEALGCDKKAAVKNFLIDKFHYRRLYGNHLPKLSLPDLEQALGNLYMTLEGSDWCNATEVSEQLGDALRDTETKLDACPNLDETLESRDILEKIRRGLQKALILTLGRGHPYRLE